MGRLSQQVLPLQPADAVAIGPVAGLVEDDDGGVVFVAGLATFAFDADDQVARRLAAVQLVEARLASAAEVATGFAVSTRSLLRWRQAVASDGVAGLFDKKPGPKGPSKLTDAVVSRARELDARGATLAAIAAELAVDSATVRVALGRRAGSAGWQARHGTPTSAPSREGDGDPDGDSDHGDSDHGDSDHGGGGDDHGPGGGDNGDPGGELAVLPDPAPRTFERELARWGLLPEAPVVFTQGAHLPMAGLLLALPGLCHLGFLDCFASVYGRLRNGFYGLQATVLALVFLALAGEPRAEGATRVRPADLGRVLGLDRAPEVKTIRRKLTELAGRRRGAELQRALARAHAAGAADALGFLHVDGHTRVYYGTRDLPKAHVARLHMAAHASAETWIGDAFADPLLVVTAVPGASLASELLRLLPEVRAMVGPRRRPTVVFDRGGWSPAVFAALMEARMHVLTYRKAPFDQVPDDAFSTVSWKSPDGATHRWRLADTRVDLTLAGGDSLAMRQVTRIADGSVQVPILTSNTALAASAVVWRMSRRWRQENYFRYARAHFALDALDTYADAPDDPARLVRNPAKHRARDAVEAARAEVVAANAAMTAALDDAAVRARAPGAGGTAVCDAAAASTVADARRHLDQADARSKQTPSHLPLHEVRPGARLMDEERKLVTHAIRMSAYNAESILARMLQGHYSRADHEARALVREAFSLSGDIAVRDGRLHLCLDPATAPRRTRALDALCRQLTATETTYPGTDLPVVYSMKDHPITT
ncbi:MAG TPA: hypothetical protein VF288_06110 [Mycobacteriales bacterium]